MSAGGIGRAATAAPVALVAVVLSVGTIACRSRAERDAALANGDDPIAALRASVTSTRYTARYWTAAAQRDTQLSSQARRYCDARRASGDGERPNCAPVEEATFELAGRGVRPPARGTGQRVDSLTFRP